ncbi:MAG: ArsR family transcriptional regulator [Candidatus Odinarchaeota archaeon]
MVDLLFLKQLFHSTTRLEILLILENSELSLSDLASKLGKVSAPEVSRHLSTLVEQDLVKRETLTRKYSLSDFGRTLVTMLNPIRFITNNRDYFQRHRLDDLPMTLMSQINLLSSSEFVEGVGSVMLELEKLVGSAENDIWAIIDTGFPFKNERVQNSRTITTPEFLYQANTDEPTQADFKMRYPSMKDITYKVLPRINIAMVLIDKDKAGAIGFPRSGEFKPDYSAMFLVNDVEGVQYLQNIFDYFWKQAQLP